MELNIEHIKFNLKIELSQFGLNPKEWLVVHNQNNLFKIINANDHSLSLLGEAQIKAHKLNWKRITLIGL